MKELINDQKSFKAPHEDTIHELKTWPPFFALIDVEFKNFEVRKNDRDFQVNDWLKLREWDPEENRYTKRECFRQVRYILEGGQFGIEKGYVVMGIDKGLAGLGSPLRHEVKY